MISVLLAAALAASPSISLEHTGTLREGLQEIARKGGLNLVASGKLTELDEQAVLHLKDISAEEALTSVAAAYNLNITHQGNLWIVRPAGTHGLVPPVPPVPPVAPLPPVPPQVPHATKAVNGDDEDAAETEAERARDHAERMRDEAEALREKAEELRDAKREAMEAAKEKAEELAEAKREELEAAKEKAEAERDAAKAQKSHDEDVVNMNGPVVVKENQRVDSAISYGGTVTVEKNARVDGDVVSFGGDVILEENARVDGDAVSFGGRVQKAEGAKVKGEEVSFGGKGLSSVVANKAVEVSRPNSEAKPSSRGGGVAGFFAEFAVLFGLGFLLMMFAPQRMKTIEAELQASPAKNGAAGLLAAIASLPLTLFLCITIIGIPVAMAFWMLAGVSAVMGLVAVANVLGSRVPVPRLRRTQAVALAVGLLAMLIVSRIPVLGPLVMSAATFVSLGAIIRTRLGQRGQGLPIPSGAFIDSAPVA